MISKPGLQSKNEMSNEFICVDKMLQKLNKTV